MKRASYLVVVVVLSVILFVCLSQTLARALVKFTKRARNKRCNPT